MPQTLRKAAALTAAATVLLGLSGCKEEVQVVDEGPRVTAPVALSTSAPILVNQTSPQSVFIPANGVAIVPFRTNIKEGVIGPEDRGTVTAEGTIVRISDLKPGATTLRIRTTGGVVADYPLVIISPDQPLYVTEDGDVRVVEGRKLVLQFPTDVVRVDNLLNDSSVQSTPTGQREVTITVVSAQQASPVLRVTTAAGQVFNLRLLVLAGASGTRAAPPAAESADSGADAAVPAGE
ncbi:hypothetical protein [Deinococcus petrolearius]|uniref:Uncharacterized protein n=1 Tax=Deinococcus petrolearius TaxID=1751295 RepID=A0ABW1DLF3_9DEIO